MVRAFLDGLLDSRQQIGKTGIFREAGPDDHWVHEVADDSGRGRASACFGEAHADIVLTGVPMQQGMKSSEQDRVYGDVVPFGKPSKLIAERSAEQDRLPGTTTGLHNWAGAVRGQIERYQFAR